MENYRTETRIKEIEYKWTIYGRSGNIYTSDCFMLELAGDCTMWRIKVTSSGKYSDSPLSSILDSYTKLKLNSLTNYDIKPAIELVDTKHPKITVDVEFRLFDSENNDLTKYALLKDQTAYKGKVLESKSCIQLTYYSGHKSSHQYYVDDYYPNLNKMIMICKLKAAVEKNELRKSSIVNDFAKLQVNGDFSDIIISVREREFRAHKIILAARSVVFSAMFKNEMKEAVSGKLEIEDMEPNSFEEFLKFIYTGYFHDKEKACDLLAAADKYDVQDLKAFCEDVIIKSINIENCFTILAFSQRHSAEKLKNETIKFIASQVPLAKIHELAEFKDPSLLMEIIEEFAKQRKPQLTIKWKPINKQKI